MVFIFEYSDVNSRQTLLENNHDKFLIEEQNLFNGNYLIFSDASPEEPQPIEQRISDLEIAIAAILGGAL